MAEAAPAFTLGIEEEYLLVDPESGQLVAAPQALMDACANAIEGQVSPEFLRCRIEVGTGACDDIASVHDDLGRLRAATGACAGRHGLAPVVAC